jgi:hypothetical protein
LLSAPSIFGSLNQSGCFDYNALILRAECNHKRYSVNYKLYPSFWDRLGRVLISGFTRATNRQRTLRVCPTKRLFFACRVAVTMIERRAA